MRTFISVVVFLFVASMLTAADPKPDVTVKGVEDGKAKGEAKVEQTVFLAYKFSSAQAELPELKKVTVDGVEVKDPQKVHTGGIGGGEDNIVFKPTKAGKYEIKVTIEKGEEGKKKTHVYTYLLDVKK